MSIIYVLIPIAMLFVLIAVIVFFWAVKSEQFDDLDRQSVSILFDDDSQQQAKSLSSSGDAKCTSSDKKSETPL
ncbi:cbb3-type cytochrome oxidase assembly protein CcoS [Shewanella sp. OMA3-2]|uniref:cbb3-type cytochrome oxidase assembly protein CcoS n=1 Tax=Shewanella sp. OMA3-2 TaxID=2908650 RepID=UPI001F1DA69D|nr:cbb3-type cytochrome oxidase assembly protein CcoS [Shewanella sp. OMA3-2]UJF20722.1 cbb3-type cytochrome oxidase assembly protein CcoS [Shewanella sp. OMA3-2]